MAYLLIPRRYLHSVLVKNPVINSKNRTVIVETLRQVRVVLRRGGFTPASRDLLNDCRLLSSSFGVTKITSCSLSMCSRCVRRCGRWSAQDWGTGRRAGARRASREMYRTRLCCSNSSEDFSWRRTFCPIFSQSCTRKRVRPSKCSSCRR